MFFTTYNAYGITSIVALCGLMVGLEQAAISAFVDAKVFLEYFLELGPRDMCLLASSTSIGAVGEYTNFTFLQPY